MRVAVFHNLPPGGARRAAFEIVRHTRDTHDYDFYRSVVHDGGDRLAEFQDIGTLAKEVFDYRSAARRFGSANVQRVVDIRSMTSLQRKIARDIDARDYDLVFVHHDRFSHAPPLLPFLRTLSLYLVQEARRPSFEYSEQRRHRPAVGPAARMSGLAASAFELWMKDRDIRATRAATQLVANSYHSAEFIWRAYGRHPIVCYLGVDAKVFVPSQNERHGVVSIGALDRIKGHDLVIGAVGGLPPNQRPPLTIVFDRERPGMREHLKSLADARGVDLHLRSGVDDTELVRLYQSSVATVCAAVVEPFGLTTVESLACGTPVVALREGGYREVVHDGHNGFLVDRRPGEITRGLARVIAEPDRWSPAALRASVIPFFSWEASGERFARVFEEVAQTRKGSASGGVA